MIGEGTEAQRHAATPPGRTPRGCPWQGKKGGIAPGWTLMAGALMLGGCAGTPEQVAEEEPAGLEAPSFEEVARTHNERVARLTPLHADGVVELRWVDGRESEWDTL